MVDKLLAVAEGQLSQVDAIAFSAGPGSFTGLRIGLSVVQGLAFGANIPVIPVSTLQVMAQGAARQRSLPVGAVVIPALDARMEEIYWGVYRVTADGPGVIVPDMLTSPEKVAAGLKATDIQWGVGEGWQYSDRFPVKAKNTLLDIVPEAQDVVVIAERLLRDGKAMPVEQAELRYLRDKVSWKKRKKLRT